MPTLKLQLSVQVNAPAKNITVSSFSGCYSWRQEGHGRPLTPWLVSTQVILSSLSSLSMPLKSYLSQVLSQTLNFKMDNITI